MEYDFSNLLKVGPPVKVRRLTDGKIWMSYVIDADLLAEIRKTKPWIQLGWHILFTVGGMGDGYLFFSPTDFVKMFVVVEPAKVEPERPAVFLPTNKARIIAILAFIAILVVLIAIVKLFPSLRYACIFAGAFVPMLAMQFIHRMKL
jgi:hypothetical protein